MAKLARPSVASLFISMQDEDGVLGTATGFLVETPRGVHLVTTRHVVRGRHQTTDEPLHPAGRMPRALHVAHNERGRLGSWVWRAEPLYDAAGTPRWREHPQHGAGVDVVGLPLSQADGVDAHCYDPWADAVVPKVFQPLAIVGFPFVPLNEQFLATWVRGYSATEPGAAYNGLPCFLVDARTTAGSAGSPAVGASKEGGARSLAGVFSGRIAADSDLGVVWTPGAVREILQGP